MEKLLQKNYFLHQSARDGYRSYLQAYASYSLKKIFDVNALDLAKVGKAFGFAVPPRVNVTVGGGKGGAGKTGKKRRRDEVDEDEEEEDGGDHAGGGEEVAGDDDGAGDEETGRKAERRQGKGRRMETLGKKAVDKEVYKRSRDWKQSKGGQQWSR